MSTRDRRHRVFESAMNNPALTHRERLFMVLLVSIKPEYVDGRRRHGSKAMGPDGQFALHLDYLARAFGTSADNVKKVRRSCQQKGHLGLVFEGTFGRPSTYEAHVVRGDDLYGVTFRQIVPPYGPEDPSARGDVTSPLAYRTPQEGDHAPQSGGLRPQVVESKAPAKKGAAQDSWHPYVEHDARSSA